ncbi:hypothetical protein SAMN05421780_111153 [Flexibacter flexilis DSM 6793]|uniref:histidine kinase n=1 Tax=Flexibacter flexilis DSM 6793 TaxID=927664 RepID=A0A1I1MXZ3_9BACT|nr:GAF domain-containing sensor histidine kinase [Flexibacter flexilis]SFC89782.1 hypothetical protein SAMN05421780_111153 [Flexibacter flexilis DSM 6793]
MKKPEIPADEELRLKALKEYSILDTLPEKEYEEITYLASQICKVPISLITLIDEKRQWFKSNRGLTVTETPRDVAFCAHAINDKQNIFIVPDSRNDARFHDNPLVTDDPYVIFYVGIPLVNPDGFALGTLCVIDKEPHVLDQYQINALKALANQVMNVFELRKKTIALDIYIKEIEEQNKGLEKFARLAAHDMKSPLANIVMLIDLFKSDYANVVNAEGNDLLDSISGAALSLNQLIDGILKYSRNAKILSENKEFINFYELIKAASKLVDTSGDVRFELDFDRNISIYTNRVALEQIFINLLSNGIKYNDKPIAEVTVKVCSDKEFVRINVIDNGLGIKTQDQERVFQLFETSVNQARRGEKGNGIGLATVKSLVEGLGGHISVRSQVGVGSDFEFTIKK